MNPPVAVDVLLYAWAGGLLLVALFIAARTVSDARAQRRLVRARSKPAPLYVLDEQRRLRMRKNGIGRP